MAYVLKIGPVGFAVMLLCLCGGLCPNIGLCVFNGLSRNESAVFDSSKQRALFIANSTRLVDMAECD